MASPNLIIIQLLHTKSNHSEFLRLCWDKLSREQKREIFHFLYIAEQYKTFLSILRIEISNDSPLIPWSHFFAILSKIDRLDPNHVREFLAAAPSSAEFGQFRIPHPELTALWLQKKEQRNEDYLGRKKELLKELEFARQRGFKDQRNRILDELKKLYPGDREIELIFQTEKEFKARQVINKVFSKRLAQVDWNPSVEDMSAAEIKVLMKVIKKKIKKQPQLALDFAIMFFQMEVYSGALAVLDLIKDKDFRILWHDLQISIEAKQYARALSTIDILKQQRLSTDHSFSLLYFQALALFGLGDETEAKQIIRNIAKIRPNFRSANSLLLEWENDK